MDSTEPDSSIQEQQQQQQPSPQPESSEPPTDLEIPALKAEDDAPPFNDPAAASSALDLPGDDAPMNAVENADDLPAADVSSPAHSPSSPPPPPPPPLTPPEPLPPYDLSALVSSAVSHGDFPALLLTLEEIELESHNGIPPADIFGCLLATNLIVNDVVNAKLLWQRIPTRIKADNQELESIWKIGKKLWICDFFGAFSELEREWSQQIAPLLNELTKSIRLRVFSLVEKSYESLRLSSLSTLLGTDPESVVDLVSERHWRVIEGFAFPSKATSTTTLRKDDDVDDALARLTDYVGYLEE